VPATAKASEWGKISLKSADSAKEKSKKREKFLFLLQQEVGSRPLPQETIFFA
jgi:hypothetical protein